MTATTVITETTAKERRNSSHATVTCRCFYCRVSRDCDRLFAALAVQRGLWMDAESALVKCETREAAARAEGEEAVLRFIESGSFLHDDAPPKRFAAEVVAAYRARSQP